MAKLTMNVINIIGHQYIACFPFPPGSSSKFTLIKSHVQSPFLIGAH